MRVGTNIASLQAQRQLQISTRAISRALERLTTGRRVNSGKDDPVALGMSERLESSRRGLGRGLQNIAEAMSSLQTADSILASQTDLVQRMRELAVQASNGTLSSTDRANLNTELETLMDEFNRVAETTQLTDFSVQVGDSKDQQIDLSFESSLAEGIFVSRNTYGTGTFTLAQTYQPSSYWLSIDDKDVNNDGHGDILYVIQDTEIVEVLLSNGDGTFEAPRTLYTPGISTIGDYIVQDVNGDGNLDFSVTTASMASNYFGNGEGGFTFASSTSIGAGVSTLSTDFNNDGIKDIYVLQASGVIAHYFGNANGSYTLAQTILSTAGVSHQRIDLNSDGFVDLATHNALNGVGTIYINNGQGIFSQQSTYGSVASANFAAYGEFDLNGDGNNDLFLRSAPGGSDFYVRLGDGAGNFSVGQTITLTSSYTVLNPTDVNGDSIDDIVAYNSSIGDVAVRYGSASGTFSVGQTLAMGNTLRGLDAKDVNDDGRVDIIGFLEDSVGVALSTTNNQFEAITHYDLNTTISEFSLHVRDFTGDGLIDIFAGGIDGHALLMNDGHGAFTLNRFPSLGFGTEHFAHIMDFNGDGALDFYGTVEDGSPTDMPFYLQNTEVIEEFETTSVLTQLDAQNALSVLSNALDKLAARRASLGANMNRLESSANAQMITQENISQALSTLRDTDIAQETAELVRAQILQQASAGVLVQANANLQMVLNLLR